MAVRFMGQDAVYIDEECTWCFGVNTGTLGSTSFASCVGLVLHSPRHTMGVVAHYSGSLGADTCRQKVRNDTLEILRAVCPVLPGIWKAWVFGGVSLMSNAEIVSPTVATRTIPLIDRVREQLRANPYIPINVLRRERTDPEMVDGNYIGHKGVLLDVATGAVTWDDGQAQSWITSGEKKSLRRSN